MTESAAGSQLQLSQDARGRESLKEKQGHGGDRELAASQDEQEPAIH